MGPVISSCKRGVDYVFNTQNSVLQGVYLVIIVPSFVVVHLEVFPRIPIDPYLPAYHRPVGYAAMALALGSWGLMCWISPGVIDASTLHEYQRKGYYAFDGVLYHEGSRCRTTGLPKPPRSKFCAVMQCNVARFDHWCVRLQGPGSRALAPAYRLRGGALVHHPVAPWRAGAHGFATPSGSATTVPSWRFLSSMLR